MTDPLLTAMKNLIFDKFVFQNLTQVMEKCGKIRKKLYLYTEK